MRATWNVSDVELLMNGAIDLSIRHYVPSGAIIARAQKILAISPEASDALQNYSVSSWNLRPSVLMVVAPAQSAEAPMAYSRGKCSSQLNDHELSDHFFNNSVAERWGSHHFMLLRGLRLTVDVGRLGIVFWYRI